MFLSKLRTFIIITLPAVLSISIFWGCVVEEYNFILNTRFSGLDKADHDARQKIQLEQFHNRKKNIKYFIKGEFHIFQK